MSRDVIGVFSVGWLMCWALGSASCVSSTDYTPLPPSVPKLRLPRNDVYEGSVITGSLRPKFVWEASTANTSGAITYELQLSADPKLEADVTTVTIAEPSYQSDAALPVSTVPPVGRRYYWRVRACLATTCSEFSPTWWVNLGRSSNCAAIQMFGTVPGVGADGTAAASPSQDDLNASEVSSSPVRPLPVSACVSLPVSRVRRL
jgi:hypothetical protein